MLLREALAGRNRDNAVIGVNYGIPGAPAGGVSGTDNRRASIKDFVAYTLRRLGTDHRQQGGCARIAAVSRPWDRETRP
jgi:aryl-alcohol dehydrogenase-like predicted oxidoreductase